MSQEKEPVYDETGRKVYSGKAILPAKNAPFYRESEQSQQSGTTDESASKEETALPMQKKKRKKKGKGIKGLTLRMAKKAAKNVEVVPEDDLEPVGDGEPQVEGNINKEENISNKDTKGEASQVGPSEAGEQDNAKEMIIDQTVNNVPTEPDAADENKDKDKNEKNEQSEMGGLGVEAAQDKSGEDNVQDKPQQAAEPIGQDGMHQTEDDKKNIETDIVQGEASPVASQSTQTVGENEKEKNKVTEDEAVQQHEALPIFDDEPKVVNETIQDSKEEKTDEKNIEDNRKRSADYQDPQPESIPEGKKSKTEESPQEEQVETPQDNKAVDFQEPVEVSKPCVEQKLDQDNI